MKHWYWLFWMKPYAESPSKSSMILRSPGDSKSSGHLVVQRVTLRIHPQQLKDFEVHLHRDERGLFFNFFGSSKLREKLLISTIRCSNKSRFQIPIKIPIPTTVDGRNLAITSWGWLFIPLFTRLYVHPRRWWSPDFWTINSSAEFQGLHRLKIEGKRWKKPRRNGEMVSEQLILVDDLNMRIIIARLYYVPLKRFFLDTGRGLPRDFTSYDEGRYGSQKHQGSKYCLKDG